MQNNSVKIAVLSGKGGTGKTLVSVNLASVAEKSAYIDCDVEEPNGHLFFKPQNVCEDEITIRLPALDNELCSGCRKCVDFCRFNALAFIKKRPFLFEEVCHSCGGCVLLCPEKALGEREKTVGYIKRGLSSKVKVSTGIMNTGEASGIPIIKKLLSGADSEKGAPVFIDCPPGSSCVVMESIKDIRDSILVAEPTVFGVHNLNMVYKLVSLFKKPCGVIVNKYFEEDNPAEEYCREKNIQVLCRLPFDNELGLINSQARIAAREKDKYKELFTSLLEAVMEEVQHETAANPQR